MFKHSRHKILTKPYFISSKKYFVLLIALFVGEINVMAQKRNVPDLLKFTGVQVIM